jgi:hypothetical protein
MISEKRVKKMKGKIVVREAVDTDREAVFRFCEKTEVGATIYRGYGING